MAKSCSISDCGRPATRRGWCQSHYDRWRMYGDPLGHPAPRLTLAERLWAKVDKDGPIPAYAPHLGQCWIWTGAKTELGRGVIRLSRQRSNGFVHKVAWELLNGPVPDGLELDHLCRVPLCVNPAHLEPVTHQENMRRSPVLGKHPNCHHGKGGMPNPLTLEQMEEAKFLWRQGTRQGEIADRFGCSPSYISRLVNGKHSRKELR